MGLAATVTATPQFARKFGVACSTCHVHVPKLNAFGEAFAANGYAMPGLEAKSRQPIAAWLSLLRQNRTSAPSTFREFPNRVELIAGDRVGESATYFAEWRVLSLELQSDGTLRDRSGRFEDLFVAKDLATHWSVQVGQFRALAQIDQSRRLSLGEPLVFSASLPGEPAARARITSLRGFSPAGRSPGLRLSYADRPDAQTADGVYANVSLLFPGEFSLPLSKNARRNASHEFESDPKGAFIEAFRRRGGSSVGLNHFQGEDGRRYTGFVGQIAAGPWFLEGGLARTDSSLGKDWRHSVWAEYVPRFDRAFGIRLDHRQVAGQRPILAPYASFASGDGPAQWRLVGEARTQKGVRTLFLVELSFQF